MLHFTDADVARFRRYVDVLPGRLILPSGRESSACHLWTGARSRGKGNRKWYGSFRLGRTTVRAHRFSCEVASKECPPGYHRDHECCNSLCVNEDHIEVVPREVNQDRKVSRTRTPPLSSTTPGP